MAKKAVSPRLARTGAKRTQTLTRAFYATGGAGQGQRIAWVATLSKGRPLTPAHLRWQSGPGHVPPLWLVVVDTSASTRRHGALARAKGFLQALFDQAYRQRARLALLTASGAGAQWHRHGLKASAALAPWLEQLGAGGGTPLPQALDEASRWLARQRGREPGQALRCVVVSDGRVKTVQAVRPLGCDTLVVDIELGSVRLGKCRELAQRLGAQYVHLEALPQPRRAGSMIDVS